MSNSKIALTDDHVINFEHGKLLITYGGPSGSTEPAWELDLGPGWTPPLSGEADQAGGRWSRKGNSGSED